MVAGVGAIVACLFRTRVFGDSAAGEAVLDPIEKWVKEQDPAQG